MQLKKIVNLLLISLKLDIPFKRYGWAKCDDPNMVKKLLFPIILHVIIFNLLYLTKFNKNMIRGQVIFFFIKIGITFNEMMFSFKDNSSLGHFSVFFMHFIVS